MLLLDPTFQDHLQHLDLEVLETSADPTYAVDRRYVIRAANPAYLGFGRDNGLADVDTSAGLGCSLLDAMGEPAREFYHHAFAAALESGEPFHHDYECSSPDLFRLFRLSAYPLPTSAGLLISHHLTHERAHDRPTTEPGPQHVSPDGVVSQCCHCRKVRNWAAPESWDWVPALVATMDPRTSHTFCDGCLRHYYRDVLE
ncbi:MAG: PAS domain-containing protein [Candidatus Krumholzibacteriia bacterium]